MSNYYQHLLMFLKRFVCLLVLYFISRLFFYILNADYFNEIGFGELVKLFVVGIRFDLAAIAFTNIVLLAFMLPGAYKNLLLTQKLYTVLFFSLNSIALLSNFMDARFFEFINKRSTSSLFTLLGANQDVWLLIPQFLKDYWYVALSWMVLMGLFWHFMPRFRFEKLLSQRMTWRALILQVLIFIGIAGCMLLGARGTRLKPLGIIDAANYAELKHVPLVLNTPFSIIKTIENENLEPLEFYTKDALQKIYHPIHQYTAQRGFQKKNVVIFILESFSKEYSGYLTGHEGYTPRLDSLLGKSLVFVNAYANGTQSYEAMPAIIAGIPSLMDRPYSGSNYADNLIESLPLLLRNEGYHTTFYHGGNNGTMGFDNFAKAAGIAYYMGREEYHNDKDYDDHWGIWDEPYLQYYAQQIDHFPQPFFTAVFTLSSHHPYTIPEKYNGQFQEGSLSIHKSIRSADYALGKFFNIARKMPWFNNTLFVFTADHAAQAIDDEYNSTTGMYAIPLAFYCPSDNSFTGVDSTLAQQIDILPSVLHYLGYQKPFFAFGESLLDSTAIHRSVSFLNGIYQLVQGDYIMLFNGKKVISFYRADALNEHSGVNSPDIITDPAIRQVYVEMETSLKAILQTYNHCLINNKMSLGHNKHTIVQSLFEIQLNQLP